jgi:cytosine/uracil/thiamine/allantoin permease
LSVVTHCGDARLEIPAAFDVPALYDPKGRYRYWAGFDPIAVAWTAIGFLICTYRPHGYQPC